MVQCIFWKSKWETFDNFSMVQLLTADHSGGHYDRTYVHQSLSPRHQHILALKFLFLLSFLFCFFSFSFYSYLHQSLSPRHHHILDQHVFRLYAYEIFCQSNCSLTTTSWTIRAQSIACVWVFVMEWKVVTQLYLSLRIGLAVQCYFFKCFRRKKFSIQDYITLYNMPQNFVDVIWKVGLSAIICNFNYFTFQIFVFSTNARYTFELSCNWMCIDAQLRMKRSSLPKSTARCYSSGGEIKIAQNPVEVKSKYGKRKNARLSEESLPVKKFCCCWNGM